MLKHLHTIVLFLYINPVWAVPYFNITTQCAGSQSTFNLTNTSGIDSVKWNFGNGTFSGMLIVSPFNTTNQYSNLGSYQVSITYYSLGIASQKDTTIIIFGVPTPYLFDFTNQCYQPIVYSVFQNGASYLWNTGATTSNINVSSSGTYWVKVTNQCGTGTDTAIVDYIYPPIQNIPAQIDLCGDTVFTIIAGPGTNSYLWQNGSTESTFLVTESTQLSVYESNQCGGVYEFTTVNYYDIPFLDLGPDTILCGQSSYELKATFKPANTVWYDGSSDTLKLITQPGTYYCKVSNFCKVLYDTVTLDFQNIPQVELGNDTLICGGEFVSWYVYNYGATYDWSNGATSAWSATYLPGKFWVTAENACGVASDTIQVQMRFIYVNIPVSDTSICVNDNYPVNVAVDSTTTYSWSDGNTNSYRNLDKPGYYIVTIANECGVVSDSINVKMFDCNYCAKFPTGFTPNKDGKNDIFRVMTDCDIRDFRLNLFNRAGNLIFSSDTKDIGWDGTFDGVDQPIGTYVFQVTYNFWDGDSLVEAYEQGNVTLIR